MTGVTDLVWDGREDADLKRAKIRRSIADSELAFARVQGMRIAVQTDPPTAATGGFPYPARTCDQWFNYEQRGTCPVKRRGRRSA